MSSTDTQSQLCIVTPILLFVRVRFHFGYCFRQLPRLLYRSVVQVITLAQLNELTDMVFTTKRFLKQLQKIGLSGILTHNHRTLFRHSNRLSYQAMSSTPIQTYINLFLLLIIICILLSSFKYQIKKKKNNRKKILQSGFCFLFTYFKKQADFLTDISLLIVSLFKKHKQIIQLFHNGFHNKELSNCF